MLQMFRGCFLHNPEYFPCLSCSSKLLWIKTVKGHCGLRIKSWRWSCSRSSLCYIWKINILKSVIRNNDLLNKLETIQGAIKQTNANPDQNLASSARSGFHVGLWKLIFQKRKGWFGWFLITFCVICLVSTFFFVLCFYFPFCNFII